MELGQSLSIWINDLLGAKHLRQKLGILMPREARISRTGTLRW
jgi:hypothetical protein